jgi:hypothetical protein
MKMSWNFLREKLDGVSARRREVPARRLAHIGASCLAGLDLLPPVTYLYTMEMSVILRVSKM